ncbi:hypothetical protein H10PHJ05_23 [Aeromonas phage HJ05]|nr:hypothetical protein H10PHJ05_23 [Aeromonas phage HJ05]
MFVTISYYPQGKVRRKESKVVDLPEGADLLASAKQYVAGLNTDIAPFQTPYVLQGVAPLEQKNPQKSRATHDWQTVSPVTVEDAAGVYHIVKCKKCRCTGRQYEGRHYVTRDPKYLDKVFDNCAASAARNIKHRRRERQ